MIFIQQDAFENVVYKMVTILFRNPCFVTEFINLNFVI